MKTVEIIIDEVPWEPGGRRRSRPRSEQGQAEQGAAGCASTPGRTMESDDARVTIQILRGERSLQALVKAAGARWLPYERLWELEFSAVRRLGLEGRVVVGR